MWMIFGTTAIITAIINLYCAFAHRNAQWFRFLSLSFTALTLCGFMKLLHAWIAAGDWSALMDTAGVIKLLIWLTVTSIILNSVSLIMPLVRNNKG